jgi:hypothetical protein
LVTAILALGLFGLAGVAAYYATRPVSFDNLFAKATRAIESDNSKEFMKCIAAIEEAPGKADYAAFLMGRWHAAHRQHVAALRDFSKCHSDEEIETKATVEAAHVFLAMNNRWDAANVLLRLLYNGRDDADAFRILAEIFQHWGANEKVIEYASLWADAAPDDPFPWLLLAEEATIHDDEAMLEKCIVEGLSRHSSSEVAAKFVALRASLLIEHGALDAAANDIAKLPQGPRRELLTAQKEFASGEFASADATLEKSSEPIKTLGAHATITAATLKMQIAMKGEDLGLLEQRAKEVLAVNKTSIVAWETLAKVAQSRGETDNERLFQSRAQEARKWHDEYHTATGHANTHTIDPGPRYELLRLALIAEDDAAVKRWKDALRELDPEGRMMPDELEPYLTGVIRRVHRYSAEEIREAEWYGRPRGSLPQFVVKE